MNVHMEEISMDVIEELGNYSVDISKTIEEELSCIVPNNLQEASIYLTKAGGKMLRPALTLITSEAVGGSRDNSLKSAAAIELIHTFSLIHADKATAYLHPIFSQVIFSTSLMFLPTVDIQLVSYAS